MPRTTELTSVHRFVEAHNLESALNALPPASELTITPQTTIPSEHPYKLHIGTYTLSSQPHSVHIGLTTTPRNGYGPSFRIFIGSKTHAFEILEDVELLQPFRRLWEKTRNERRWCERAWKDMRRGVVKGFAYWYLLGEAEGRGAELLVPGTVRGYFVEGLKRVGVGAYGRAEREVVVGGNGGGRKRRAGEMDEDEDGVEQDAGRHFSGNPPSGFERAGRTSSGRTDDDARSEESPGIITDTNIPATTLQATDTASVPRTAQGLTQPSQYSEQSTAQPYASDSIIQLPSQGHERLLRPTTEVSGPAQFDEFKKLKEMMDVDTALDVEYALQLARTEALKEQLEKHREAIRKVMADAVAGGSA
ncbi:hypothetical protein P171DRAFT_438059 [Karstenula rhodostoma CBS 690.94]|uniref:Uncharacterized protein n=1 Tax=Karstenula rhodostoma CBS 690.94 TaxID=1392251 RepID=A0A9P4PTY5_9PLEO|nr:hypothetical protein P171DRAFT_438059 [Karstenula rhodostoma CBS 690.94]